jgi:NRAMP (natural resistance-associated macrophage protein)-like metal ion transporter
VGITPAPVSSTALPASRALFSFPGSTVGQSYDFLTERWLLVLGNYATDVAAGATFRFKLLFIVLMSNIFAIFLQSLCIKLGSVTGMNLAESCKANLPPWLNYLLYFFAESAIIATDIAEVCSYPSKKHILNLLE